MADIFTARWKICQLTCSSDLLRRRIWDAWCLLFDRWWKRKPQRNEYADVTTGWTNFLPSRRPFLSKFLFIAFMDIHAVQTFQYFWFPKPNCVKQKTLTGFSSMDEWLPQIEIYFPSSIALFSTAWRRMGNCQTDLEFETDVGLLFYLGQHAKLNYSSSFPELVFHFPITSFNF